MSLVTTLHQIEGVVDIWGGVHEAWIGLCSDGHHSIRIDGWIHDGVDSVEEFLEEVGGKIFTTMEDYKKDNSINLREWVKDSGWIQGD